MGWFNGIVLGSSRALNVIVNSSAKWDSMKSQWNLFSSKKWEYPEHWCVQASTNGGIASSNGSRSTSQVPWLPVWDQPCAGGFKYWCRPLVSKKNHDVFFPNNSGITDQYSRHLERKSPLGVGQLSCGRLTVAANQSLFLQQKYVKPWNLKCHDKIW